MTPELADRRWIWLPLLALLLLGAAACTQSTAPNVSGSSSGSSEVPDEVKQLPIAFYQGAGAEPGQNFDLNKVRSVTADPLQAAVVQDLEQTQSKKSATAYYRYQDVQVLGGSCTGQGNDRTCEIRVQRAFDTTDTSDSPQGARNDIRVFRAQQIGGQWKLTDTQVDGRWLSDIAAGGAAPSPGS